MCKSGFREEQIVAALQLAKSGGDVSEICRKLGVTRTTFYRWKSKSAAWGSGVSLQRSSRDAAWS